VLDFIVVRYVLRDPLACGKGQGSFSPVHFILPSREVATVVDEKDLHLSAWDCEKPVLSFLSSNREKKRACLNKLGAAREAVPHAYPMARHSKHCRSKDWVAFRVNTLKIKRGRLTNIAWPILATKKKSIFARPEFL
jgi:hypothetical protein